jgi:glycerol-1-phosphate dehydrogenase [NAD(P)+]
MRRMRSAEDAVHRLPELLRSVDAPTQLPIRRVAVGAPMRRAPEELRPLVQSILQASGWAFEAIVAEPDSSGQMHTDLEQIGQIQARLLPGCAVVAIGSGTITDIAKHACHPFEKPRGHRPLCGAPNRQQRECLPPPNMAPIFLRGVKRALPSRYRDALVCDLGTLRDAARLPRAWEIIRRPV